VIHALPPNRLVGQLDVPDLAAARGGRLVVTSPGSPGNLLARAALRRAGLETGRDVELMVTESDAARLAMLETRQAQGAMISVPFDAMLIHRGYPVIADALELNLDLPITGVVTSVAKLKDSPDEVRQVLRAILRAQQFIRERREETVAYAAEALSLDPQLVAGEMDRIIRTYAPNGEIAEAQYRRFFELNFAEDVDLGIQPEHVPYPDLYDYTALRAARRDLGQ
jgi:ABC-type nitrate/sulfonate/bicarbonate transport system substrate-binding protein